MNIKNLILKKLKSKLEIKASEIVRETGFSRAYINRFFCELCDEGRLILTGKANQARYILATEESVKRTISRIKSFHKILINRDLSEHEMLAEIKRRTGIYKGLPENIASILDYAFTEILNNAIEHSGSKKIIAKMERDESHIRFIIEDSGIGIFNSIIQKKRAKNVMEAIQDLIKGKLTTDPKSHSGEGIFFSSKASDIFTIKSFKKQILFNNLIQDIFIKDQKPFKGTRVLFSISKKSKQDISEIFKKYTDDSYGFSKTEVKIKLFEANSIYISRSQARRLLTGLEKFKKVILDFKNIETIGQSFADEIFRIWQKQHTFIKIISINTNENIDFMINRAKSNSM